MRTRVEECLRLRADSLAREVAHPDFRGNAVALSRSELELRALLETVEEFTMPDSPL
jgi:hypothetical protein